MSYENHLYMILFPNCALVGSQLNPSDFAKHFITGSSKYFTGKLIFAEIDAKYRHPYFKIDKMLESLVPHEDGRPKSTKYVSTYRVLEHVDFDAIKKLYLSTPEGYTIELNSGNLDHHRQERLVRVYTEIAPVSMLLLSDYNFLEFSDFITDPENLVGAPSMFYTQIELDTDDFLSDFASNPLVQAPIPDVHPGVLNSSILELQAYREKHTKGLTPANPFGKISFRKIKHGFMFGSKGKNRFFPMPSLKEIEEINFKFWKTM